MKAKEQTGEAPNYNKDSIKVLDLSNCTGLTSIGSYAFVGSGLTSIDLSNTRVTTIPHGIFSRCYNLTEVRLPKDLKTITEGQSGADAFQYCEKLKHIYFYNVPEIGPRAFDGVAANNLTIHYPSLWDSDGNNSLNILKQRLGDSGLWKWPYTLSPAAYLLGF